MDKLMFKIFVISTILKYSKAIIGFNCGSTNPIITTYSLLDTGVCDFQNAEVNKTETYIELLQLAEFRSLPVIQCKIEIRRTIFHCGMFSHLGPTENAVQEYIYEISHETCKSIHETGIFKYDNVHTISGLKVNSTKSIGLDLAGTVQDKSCSGASYSDNFGSWSNVFVQGLIKITLLENFATVSLNDNKIRLNSGTVCKFTEQHCIDMEGGYSFWSFLPKDDCLKNKYDVLFRGSVMKISSPEQETIFSISTDTISFALAIKEDVNFCNRVLIRTEHPKLFIYEKSQNNLIFNNDVRNQGILNLDIFTYLNSKFVYVEKHFRAEEESLYRNILKDKCELERQVLYNSLSIASLSPDEFAFNLMKKPGYIARIAGEVVHIIQCTPVEVQLFHTDNCYSQLPVTSGNQTWYLTPKTHILLKTGTQINCNTIIPQYFRIGDEWISLMPKPRRTNNKIKTLQPDTKVSWKAEKLESLATSGIYSQEDLQELQNHIMFPMEKSSLLNTIARGMQGEENIQGGLINNLFTENTLTHIAENTWRKFIDKLTKFGSISSAIIMILIIIHFCKLAIDLAIRGYTLHAVYGCSLHVLGAFFSSITHLLIVLKRNSLKETEGKSNFKDDTLKEIVVHKPIILENLVSRPPPPLPSVAPVVKPISKGKPYVPAVLEKKNFSMFNLEPLV